MQKVKFKELFEFQKKSHIKAGDGLLNGEYRFFVSSDKKVMFYDEAQFTEPALIFGTGGKASIHFCKEPFSVSTDCVVAHKNNENVLEKYCYFWFRQGNLKHLEQGFKGSGLKHISKAYINELEIPLPSLSEQEKIVEKIEELFSHLDNAVNELKQAQEKLKIYRQAVLKEAFEGFQNWNKSYFSDLMEVIKNGYSKKPDDTGEFKILKISAIRPMKLDFLEVRFNETQISKEYIINTNDILFTRYNGNSDYVGTCAVVPELSEIYAYPDKIIKCTPKIKNSIHSKYLQYYLLQGDARKYIRSKIKTTSGQNGISGEDLKKTVIYCPDLTLQKQIVSEIESKLSICDNVEKNISENLLKAENLKQAILQKAFKGELV